MFRKMAPSQLPEQDCHANLRQEFLASLTAEEKEPCSFNCVSIAWDYQFTGITSDGIHKELKDTLECANMNRLGKRKSLGIPETCVLKMAEQLAPETATQVSQQSIFVPVGCSKTDENCVVTTEARLKGILPSLVDIVERLEMGADKVIEKAKISEAGVCVEVDSATLASVNEAERPQNPYPASYCHECHQELSNVFLHCCGCETLLSRDYDICVECFCDGKYKRFVTISAFQPDVRDSTHNHTGQTSGGGVKKGKKGKKKKKKTCKSCQKMCGTCSLCTACGCQCHRKFKLQRRFYTREQVDLLVERVQRAAEAADAAEEKRLANDTDIERNKDFKSSLDAEEETMEEAEAEDEITVGESQASEEELAAIMHQVSLFAMLGSFPSVFCITGN